MPDPMLKATEKELQELVDECGRTRHRWHKEQLQAFNALCEQKRRLNNTITKLRQNSNSSIKARNRRRAIRNLHNTINRLKAEKEKLRLIATDRDEWQEVAKKNLAQLEKMGWDGEYE